MTHREIRALELRRPGDARPQDVELVGSDVFEELSQELVDCSKKIGRRSVLKSWELARSYWLTIAFGYVVGQISLIPKLTADVWAVVEVESSAKRREQRDFPVEGLVVVFV